MAQTSTASWVSAARASRSERNSGPNLSTSVGTKNSDVNRTFCSSRFRQSRLRVMPTSSTESPKQSVIMTITSHRDAWCPSARLSPSRWPQDGQGARSDASVPNRCCWSTSLPSSALAVLKRDCSPSTRKVPAWKAAYPLASRMKAFSKSAGLISCGSLRAQKLKRTSKCKIRPCCSTTSAGLPCSTGTSVTFAIRTSSGRDDKLAARH
mmetsp:Transcript_25237/g.70369  ORF Transcript_25237/g.70369 Transcript_25237/m.70369 type:complete len:209 (-) Transcript_25237:315-941(-)